MPCNAEYMGPHGREIELSRVACLLDELDGKPIDAKHWRGYHPDIYKKGGVDGDALVFELCLRLRANVGCLGFECGRRTPTIFPKSGKRCEHE